MPRACCTHAVISGSPRLRLSHHFEPTESSPRIRSSVDTLHCTFSLDSFETWGYEWDYIDHRFGKYPPPDCRQKESPRFPGPLLALRQASGNIAFWPRSLGVSIVGHVPKGLPAFRCPQWTSTHYRFVSDGADRSAGRFMESFSIAKWVAAREKYKIDTNRELIGLGLANMAASFFSSYPVTEGFRARREL